MIFRLVTTCGVFMLVLTPFGVFATWWGAVLAFVAQVLVGMAFACLVYGFSARLHAEAGVRGAVPPRHLPAVPVLRRVLPDLQPRRRPGLVARLTPLWHGVNLSRMFCVDNVDWSVAAINVAYLVVLALFGWRWSVSGLTKRLVT